MPLVTSQKRSCPGTLSVYPAKSPVSCTTANARQKAESACSNSSNMGTAEPHCAAGHLTDVFPPNHLHKYGFLLLLFYGSTVLRNTFIQSLRHQIHRPEKEMWQMCLYAQCPAVAALCLQALRNFIYCSATQITSNPSDIFSKQKTGLPLVKIQHWRFNHKVHQSWRLHCSLLVCFFPFTSPYQKQSIYH